MHEIEFSGSPIAPSTPLLYVTSYFFQTQSACADQIAICRSVDVLLRAQIAIYRSADALLR